MEVYLLGRSFYPEGVILFPVTFHFCKLKKLKNINLFYDFPFCKRKKIKKHEFHF
eukprot:UN24447